MSAANSARNRKSASLKVVPVDRGAPDPAGIATALGIRAIDLSKLFRAIARVNASEIHCKDGGEDLDIDLLAEIGQEKAEKLADALDSFQFGLGGSAHHMAEAAKSAGGGS
jgi:hypothetical protein